MNYVEYKQQSNMRESTIRNDGNYNRIQDQYAQYLQT
mgnify:CR=1 FL=1